jgi:ESAT-6 protein secretion system EspG family protein
VKAQSLLVGADRFGFTLEPLELSVLRQAHGVRSRLFPLRLGSTTGDPVRLAALMDAVDEALDRRGLSERGQLHPPVLTAFDLLADHRVAVSITGAPDDLTALAVSDGEQAISITQPTEDELVFALFPAGELVSTVVSLLPPAQAASGAPVVVDRDFAGAGADELAAELAGRRVGGGLLVASGRGRHEMWSDMLGWVDTPRGRHLVRTATDRSGNFAAQYLPAGPAELTAAVTELLESDR